MKKIYITGISGTGKTTIAKKLAEQGFCAISIDEVLDLCFWINKQTKEKITIEVELNKDFIDAHDWVCDIESLKNLINKQGAELIFVLGIAANQNDFLNLFDEVLLLQCSPETFIARIENRTDNDFGKDKTAQETILNSYQAFEKEMLERGATPINVEGSIDEVVEKILKI